jgi:hypothetical protein
MYHLLVLTAVYVYVKSLVHPGASYWTETERRERETGREEFDIMLKARINKAQGCSFLVKILALL